MADSDAVRTAPLESPARRRARSSVAAEAAQLTADEVDRAEMRSLLVEQATVVDPDAMGRSAGRLDANELRAVDEALALVLGL